MKNMISRMTTPLAAGFCCLILSLFSHTAMAQPRGDTIIGTWELDRQQSIFPDGETPPQSQTRIYELEDGGLKATLINVDANGVRNESFYVARYDGVSSPLVGSRIADEVFLNRISTHEATATLTHAGMEVGQVKRTVSQDGQRLTVEVIRRGNVVSRSVFRRVE